MISNALGDNVVYWKIKRKINDDLQSPWFCFWFLFVGQFDTLLSLPRIQERIQLVYSDRVCVALFDQKNIAKLLWSQGDHQAPSTTAPPQLLYQWNGAWIWSGVCLLNLDPARLGGGLQFDHRFLFVCLFLDSSSNTNNSPANLGMHMSGVQAQSLSIAIRLMQSKDRETAFVT